MHPTLAAAAAIGDTHAAVRELNAWAAAQRSLPRQQLEAELDAAVARLTEVSRTPVVRVGRRLHAATRLRFH